MAVEYTIFVYDSGGVLQSTCSDAELITIGRVVNGYDTLDMIIPYDSLAFSSMQQGARIEVYRQDTALGIPANKEFNGFIQKTTFSYTQRATWRIVAFGWEYLLSYRIIAYNEDSNTRTQWASTAASTIINDILVKNLGSDSVAVTYLNRAVSGLITGVSPTTTGLGNLLTVTDFSYKNVLTAIKEIALQGNVDFEFLWNSATNDYTFNVASPTLATDRTAIVRFSMDNGTIGSLEVTDDYTQYYTQAIVRGQGTANATIRTFRPNPALTELASREAFFDLSAAGNNYDYLASYGDLKLQEAVKKRKTVTVDIQQTPSNLYGFDYFIGDLVTVDLVTEVITMQINNVILNYDNTGNESVKVQLEIDN
jgi:hypothetical protein